jgi:hypothetical protein
VNAVTAEYMLAMKALAGRPQDASDVQTLTTHLGLTTAEEALMIVKTHASERLLTPRVRYWLEDQFMAADEDLP